MKIVFSSDWHLDAVTDGCKRFSDGSFAATASVSYALKTGADAFVFVGDLADPDSPGVHRAVAYTARMFARLHANNIPVYCVTGNHDVLEDGSGDSVLMALREVGAMVAEYPRVYRITKGRQSAILIALPYTPASHSYDPDAWIRETADTIKADVDGDISPVIIAGHLNAEGIATGSESSRFARGRSVFWPISAIKECFPDALMVGGHYHRAQEYNGLHIVGSQARLRHDEEDHVPSFLVAELSDAA